MNIINSWESAVNFVIQTGDSYTHSSGCILNKSYNFIEIQLNGNNYNFPKEQTIKFLNKHLPF